jgi:polysaccharide export outer membrane protein
VLRTIARTIFIVTLACTVPSLGAFGLASEQNSYKVAPGDNLTVTVFGQQELSGPYTVDAEGYVQLPLGGPLHVEGLTLRETQNLLKSRLADGYVIDPEVSIRIAELRPVSMIGAVKRPGSFPFRFGMTAADVLALSGGFGSEAQLTTSSIPQLLSAKERLALLKQNRRDLLIRLARTDAELSRNERLVVPPELESDGHPRVLSMIEQQQALLLRLNEAHQRTLELIKEQRPRLEAEILELQKERKAAARKYELAKDYAKIQEELKAKGWARAVTVLNAETAVADYEGMVALIDGKLSGLSRSLGDLELQLQKEENERIKRITGEKESLLAKLNEVDVSLPLAERIVALMQDEVDANAYSNQAVTYKIFLIRKSNAPGESPEVELLDSVSPGDILDVRVTLPEQANDFSAWKGSDTKGPRSLAANHRTP